MNLAYLLLLAAWARTPVWGQGFGQNQVIRDRFDWKVRSTEHFDVHYYEGSAPRAAQAARILEDAFKLVARDLEIRTEAPAWATPAAKKRMAWRRRPFFLYANPNDFQQSNIAYGGDGTGGITEPFKDRFMVYNDGTDRWLEEVITHEFVHVMQFHVLISGPWRSGSILKTIIYPLWMIEGMSGYVTYGIESALEEMTIRDAATSGGLIPLVHLEHFGHLKPHQITLAYKQGAAALEFMGAQFGRRKIARMLKLFESRFETSAVLSEVIGLDSFQFDRKYREYEQAKYRREVRLERLNDPQYYGAPLTRAGDNIPQYNTAPVFSPDGRTMYFVSTRDGHPSAVFSLDMKRKRSRRLWSLDSTTLENLPTGNFANLSRVLSISRDGKRLAFAATRNHRDGIYLYDLDKGRLERRDLPGFMTVAQPAFSPDGRRLAFSGMKDSVTDIYLYDLADGKTVQLTSDPEDDEMPVFAPDGESIVYSCETRDPLDPARRGRRLYRLDLKDRSQTRLEDSGGEARDPLVSADGTRILFVRMDDRFSEVCELDLAAQRVTRLTRSVGGSFTPVYVPDGTLAFAALRKGSVHIYQGSRSNFESDVLSAGPRERSVAEKFRLPGMGGGVAVSSAAVAFSPERPYRFSASTDLFLPAFFYSSPGGFFWTSYWQGSDLLGDHQAAALVSVHSGESYDYQADYQYRRYRPQLALGAYGMGRQDLLDEDTSRRFNDSVHGQYAAASYPWDRYHRSELGLSAISERIEYPDDELRDDRQARLGYAAVVRDAVRGRYLVATSGNRVRLSVSEAAEVLGGSRRYHIAGVEGHQFLHTGGQSALAFRAVGLQALGRDHPDLILGGLGGVRGYGRSTTRDHGNRLAVANAEWRFPIFPDLNYHMWYMFPDLYFKAVFGTLFTDVGAAWSSEGELEHGDLHKLRNSVGLGLRIYTFVLQEFPLFFSMDYAHRTTQNGGIFYFYLGHIF